MSKGSCDPEVYEGDAVCYFVAPSEEAEKWVRAVAKESGQRVDWHYMAGRAVVRFLGDELKVRRAIIKLKPDLESVKGFYGFVDVLAE